MYGRGLMVFDDDKQEFEKLADWDMKTPGFPSGHSSTDGGGVEYIFSGQSLSAVRADAGHFTNPADYESYTCLQESKTLDEPVMNGTDGRPRGPGEGAPGPSARRNRTGSSPTAR